MTYPFHTRAREQTDGSTSAAFRLTAAILASAAVLLFFMVGTDAGLGSASAWIVAAAIGVAAFVLAHVLITVIMIVVAPALIIAVLVRFLAT
ncbi:hypothetical protein [Massilia sp. S19_KUP03_FR1]|uniref:hypothetical protein n=1 Tax=Massilia sp. S19_KUP03_FR1 TaxID=3025503 RepID=UPI002FCDD068